MIITGLYASILALLIIYLAFKVVRVRQTKQIGIGDAGNSSCLRAIRAHANAVEYVPVIIILMALFESNGGSSVVVHIIGITVVLARGLHASGLTKSAKRTFGRFYGTLLTWLSTIALAGLNIYQFIQQM